MKTRIVFFVVLMSALGCEEYKEPIIPVGGKIIIEMIEEEGESGGLELIIKLESDKKFLCVNYPFDLKSKIRSNKIKFKVDGVVESGFCLTASGPATSKVNIGLLKNKVYDFEFHVSALKFEGELKVSEEMYELSFEENIVLELKNSILIRE